MSIAEIFRFLLPDGNRVQWLFLVAMTLLASSSAIGVSLSARPRNWAKMWTRHTEASATDFAADHGSINELSHAVATRAERFADMVPGILLILGLLGTFLGLGVALNDAADLLANPPGDSGAMSGTMSGLTHMMSGLGTKFKTSAWGIIAFLSLKAWFACLNFDDKRLAWCVERFNETLAVARRAHREREEAAQDRLVKAIEAIGAQYACIADERREEQAQVIATLKAVQISVDRNGRQAGDTHTMLDGHLRSQHVQQAAGRREFLETFAALKDSIDTLARQSHDTHAMIETGMRDQSAALSDTAEHMKETRGSLEQFIAANSQNLETMREAGLRMTQGADNVAKSAQALGEGVESFRASVGETLRKMQQDLECSITEMNGTFQTNIAEMNGGFRQSIESMTERLSGASKDIGTAAGGIAKAVDSMSSGVRTTLEEVSALIKESSNNQTDLLEEFNQCSADIQKSTEGAMGIMKDLAEPIKFGLRSISDSCLRMGSIVDSCTVLERELAKASKNSQGHSELIKRLSENIDVVSRNLKQAADAITSARKEERKNERKDDEVARTLERLVDMRAQSQVDFKNGVGELVSQLEAIKRRVKPAVLDDADAIR
jgi:methyl-accepting chemotaxis protein